MKNFQFMNGVPKCYDLVRILDRCLGGPNKAFAHRVFLIIEV